MTFGQFYSMGGGFMHAVTVCAVAMLWLGGRYYWKRRGRKSAPDLRDAATHGIRAMIVGAILLGTLGTVMGFIEASAAIQSVPPEKVAKAMARGHGISLHTVTWALMVSIPGWFLQAVIGRHGRGAPRIQEPGMVGQPSPATNPG
jgi:hypothetical protein